MTDQPIQAPQPGGGAAPDAPQIRVLAQYIKDSSFENPAAPDSLRAGQNPPNIDLGIDVRARKVDDTRYEVVLSVDARATRGEDVAFLVELKYGGLFEFLNIPEADIEPLLIIECPRMLFPFARRILAEQSRDGGFPPLYIDPIDFNGLYRQQLAQRAAETADSSGA